MINIIKKRIRFFQEKLKVGDKILKDKYFIETKVSTLDELSKEPSRTKIINHLLSLTNADNYLEIGVRNPQDNFNHIKCEKKYSVDPGIEFKSNPVDFKMTSDAFFESLFLDQLDEIKNDIKFDLIFIDGLHLADQVENDILNALKFISDKGFIVLHDCNPPTEFHQREDYYFRNSPARGFWNGTTWKAFYKFRCSEVLYSICFDSDWGIGVFSKCQYPMFNNLEGEVENSFYEYLVMNSNRKKHLNLVDFFVWEKLTLK